jgi:hypothetical protein
MILDSWPLIDTLGNEIIAAEREFDRVWESTHSRHK